MTFVIITTTIVIITPLVIIIIIISSAVISHGRHDRNDRGGARGTGVNYCTAAGRVLYAYNNNNTICFSPRSRRRATLLRPRALPRDSPRLHNYCWQTRYLQPTPPVCPHAQRRGLHIVYSAVAFIDSGGWGVKTLPEQFVLITQYTRIVRST